MLTGVQNRVAMPTSTFRADMLSTKSNNRTVWRDKDILQKRNPDSSWRASWLRCTRLSSIPVTDAQAVSVFCVVLLYIVPCLGWSFSKIRTSDKVLWWNSASEGLGPLGPLSIRTPPRWWLWMSKTGSGWLSDGALLLSIPLSILAFVLLLCDSGKGLRSQLQI